MKIVAFLCTWCSYAGADLAGTGRNQYPPNVRVIRIPCSGRINPIYIIKALLEGADGVMVSGCHPGDCHYLVGNYYARRRFVVLKKLLTTAGFEPNRVQFTWVSASEGVRFADVIRKVTEKVSAVGPSPVGSLAEISPVIQKQGDGSPTLQTQNDNHSFEKQQKELMSLCKKLLEGGTVSTIIGFKKGGEMGMSLPCIIDSPDEVEKLVWNNRCVPNLSGYLSDSPVERKGKTAIIAKPCDARAIVSLIKENQLKRDDVYIIGLTCDGMVDGDGKPLHGCLDCRVRIPPIYDELIGSQGDGGFDSSLSPKGMKNSRNDEQQPDHSIERFVGEMNKCILCYSCRQSCYGCYCKTCFMERGEPDWQTSSPDMGAKMLYHLGRAMHLSGRCVECGACENACASGVDIRYLIKAVTSFIEETYDYQAGMDIDAEPAMLTYNTDDEEIGFLSLADIDVPDIAGGEVDV